MRTNNHLKNYVLIFRPSQLETFLLLNASDHTVIISYNGAKFWPSLKPWTISMYVGGLIGQYLITTFLWPVHSIGDVGAKTCTLNLVKRFASWLGTHILHYRRGIYPWVMSLSCGFSHFSQWGLWCVPVPLAAYQNKKKKWLGSLQGGLKSLHLINKVNLMQYFSYICLCV